MGKDQLSQSPEVTLPRRLGHTNMRVTPICIGTTALGDMPETYGFGVDRSTAHNILKRIFSNKNPFNFVDTAAIYGKSEARIGNVLHELGGIPSDMVLSTKVDRDPNTGDFSGNQVRKSLEESFQRLGVNYLPLVFLHDPEHSSTPFEELLADGGAVSVLEEYQRTGKIGAIGISGGPIDMLIDFVNTGRFDVVITHNRYNLINRTAEPLLQVAAERGVAVINAAPYASGILARKDGRFAYQEPDEDIRRRVDGIQAVCDKYGIPMEAVALQFSLRDPRISSTIVGVSEEDHLDKLFPNATRIIPYAIWKELEQFNITTGDPEEKRRQV